MRLLGLWRAQRDNPYLHILLLTLLNPISLKYLNPLCNLSEEYGPTTVSSQAAHWPCHRGPDEASPPVSPKSSVRHHSIAGRH